MRSLLLALVVTLMLFFNSIEISSCMKPRPTKTEDLLAKFQGECQNPNTQQGSSSNQNNQNVQNPNQGEIYQGHPVNVYNGVPVGTGNQLRAQFVQQQQIIQQHQRNRQQYQQNQQKNPRQNN